ncbi:hypothetical protein AB0953_11285 [Streptomyces sp. NPDC046866]|uniref:hypothetical protein n=1 Tax=Streptomyces sp. NPDC046866 TaxID=3154921 RepID=UPI003457184B
MGTRRPESGAPAIPTTELRAALLALNGTEVPFSVRDAGAEGSDLLAEWRVLEPAWGTGVSRRQVERTMKVWMRLLPKEREVRAMDEQWTVTRAGDPPGVTVGRERGRGPLRSVHKEWVYEKGPDGRRRKVESFSLDTRDMKNPLRDTVTGAGWTWRGVYKL